MISKNTFVFALLALFAVQCVNSRHIEQDPRLDLDDVIQKIEEALERLGNAIKDAFAKAQDKLAALKEAIQKKVQEIIDNAKKAITAKVEEIKKIIEELKQKAAEHRVDIKECLVENEDELRGIPDMIIKKLIECITDKYNEALHIINNAIDKIIDIKDSITSLPDDLNKCMKGNNKLECMKNLLSEIVSDISSLPALIQDTVSGITQLINGLEEDMKACAMEKLMEASKEAAAIGGKIARCVADKMKEDEVIFKLLL